MAFINLRKYYPAYYIRDCIVEVPDEVSELLLTADRAEAAYRRKVYYHKAHYSLDCGDGIENDILVQPETPWETYEREFTAEEIRAALAALPSMQAQRIYAHYFLDLSMREIARREGVNVASVHESIHRGLDALRKLLDGIR